ncbi:isochorismatase family cysteine hydrolase [Paenibacillus flagellatus]|uniref:Cysteine hydrolase n=1 Tax=Paenibacillus flagellatus TaxID=2211139 RepID=A0A2V5JXC6_9BACL|nr:isochorismatase family cysteine hydrolase [Paenibacillus flagellatus]PYI51505.1 cysteine hydrolase [Paenibacillus flagellatus]
MEHSTDELPGTAPARRDTALLIVDVQHYAAHRQGGEFRHLSDDELERQYGYFFEQLHARALPGMRRLLHGCRQSGVEVLYTVIESLTLDGRDRSRDHKLAGIHVPKGSWDAQVLADIAPIGDEIVLPKTATNVFIATHIDYILRNLGIRHLIVCGLLTDQCVESAVRDACDLNYDVTLAVDACVTYSAEQHDNALKAMSGFCRQLATDDILRELGAGRGRET